MAEKGQENITMRTLCLLAIIFVVDGHVPQGDLFDFGGLLAYYSFHLMMFAFASGYFFRLHGTALQDLAHRAKRLLVPLYVWNLVYGLLAALLRRFGGFELGAELTPYTLLLAPVLDGEHFVYNLGAWFLFPLFFAQICYAALRRVLGSRRESDIVSFAACLIAGMGAVACLQRGIGPVWLLRGIVLLPGYAGGALYRERLEKQDTLPSLPYMTGLLIARGMLLLLFGRLSYLLSTGTWIDCGPLGVYLSAATAIAFWLRAARLLAPAVQKSRAALFLSRHTLSVMMHHYMGFFAVDCFFLVLNWTRLGAAEFSVSAFRTKSPYLYAPDGSAGWTVLYLCAGLLLPCVISLAGEKILAKFRKQK